MTRQTLMVLIALFTAALLLALLLPMSPAAAQPGQRTPRPERTPPPEVTRPQPTLTGPQITRTPLPDYAATAQARATQTNLNPTAIRATALAAATRIADFDLTDEQIEALTLLLESVIIDLERTESGALVSVTISEAGFNAIVDALADQTEYSAEQISVDLIPGGMIITVEDAVMVAGQNRDLVVELAVSAVDGEVVIEVVSVSPGAQTAASNEVAALVGSALNAQTDAVTFVEVDAPISYSVAAVTIEDAQITLVIALTFE
jgi:hypothetical protein